MQAKSFVGCEVFLFISIFSSATPAASIELKSGAETKLTSVPVIREKILETIELYMEQHFKPLTIRIINHETKEEEFDWDLISRWPTLNGNTKPLQESLDPRRISTGRQSGWTEVFRYVVVVWIFNEQSVNSVLENIKKTVNRRWDRVIFVGTSDILNKIMFQAPVEDLKEKVGIAVDTGEVWVDPLIYNNGRLIRVSSVFEKPVKKRIGGMLRGRHLKVAGCEFMPWVYKESEKNGVVKLAGNHYSIVVAGSEHFNYTFETSYSGWNYGETLANGTWTGMYSGVFYPEKGFHFTFFLSHDITWSYGVDYPSTITTADIIFVTGHPRTQLQWYAFMLPFSRTVWIWVICSYIILGFIQFWVMYFWHNCTIKYVVIDSAIFLPYSMAMEQGLMEIPSGARYLSLVWLAGCVVLGTGYRSTLRTNLAFPAPEPVPLTYEELSDRPDYGVTLNNQGVVETTYIKTTQATPIVKIRPRLKFQPEPVDCIIDVYMSYKTACITWSPLIEQEIGRSMTLNSRVDPLLYSKNAAKRVTMSLAFQKDSILVDSFFGVTQGVFESGILRKWEIEENAKFKQKGIAKMRNETGTLLYKKLYQQAFADVSEDVPLKTDDLKVVFGFIPIGIFFGAIFFGIEHYIWNKEIVDAYCKEKWIKVKERFTDLLFWKEMKPTNVKVRQNPELVSTKTDKAAELKDLESQEIEKQWFGNDHGLGRIQAPATANIGNSISTQTESLEVSSSYLHNLLSFQDRLLLHRSISGINRHDNFIN